MTTEGSRGDDKKNFEAFMRVKRKAEEKAGPKKVEAPAPTRALPLAKTRVLRRWDDWIAALRGQRAIHKEYKWWVSYALSALVVIGLIGWVAKGRFFPSGLQDASTVVIVAIESVRPKGARTETTVAPYSIDALKSCDKKAEDDMATFQKKGQIVRITCSVRSKASGTRRDP